MSVEDLIKKMESMSDEEINSMNTADREEAFNIINQYQSSKEPAMESVPEETMSQAEAAAYAVSDNFFIKDAVALGKSVYEEATDADGFDIDKIVPKYEEKRRDIEQKIEIAKNEYPMTTMVADVGTNIAGTLLGGAALKGAGLAAKGLSLAASGTLLEGINEVSRQDVGERDLGDLGRGLAQGAAGEAIGFGVGKVLNKAGQLVKKGVSEMDTAVARNFFKTTKASANKLLKNHFGKTRQTADDFLSDVFSYKTASGEQVLNPALDIDVNLEKLSTKLTETGQDISSVYRKADALVGKPIIDLNSVKSDLNTEIISGLRDSSVPGAKELADSLEPYINSLGKNVTQRTTKVVDGVTEVVEQITPESQITLTRLNDIKKDVLKGAKVAFKSTLGEEKAAEQYRRIGHKLNEVIADTLNKVEVPDENLLTTLKQLNKEYGNLSVAEELLEGQRQALKDNGFFGDLKKMFTGNTGFLSVAGAGIGGAIGGIPGATIGGGLGQGLNAMLSSPKAPSYIKKYGNTLANKLMSEPMSKMSVRLVAALAKDSDVLESEVNSEIAKIHLEQSPVQRNTSDAIMKSEHIRHLLKRTNPMMADAYENLLEEGSEEELAQFMDSASKIPEAKKLFQPGVGFNGKVYTDEDKALLITQLNQSGLSGSQRVRLIKQIKDTGMIPDMQTQAQPQPIKTYTPRNKRQLQF